MNLGWPEILLIAGIAVLLFGPTKLPQLGKSMGEAIRGFKKGMQEAQDAYHEEEKPQPRKENLTHHDSGTAQTQARKDETRHS